MNEIFSNRIKELRLSLNLTQTAFANKIGTSQNALSGYETGDRVPSFEILVSISKHFNVSIDWLCGISERKFSHNPTTYADIMMLSAYILTAHDDKEKKFVSDLEITKDEVKINFHDDYIMRQFLTELDKILSSVKDGTIPKDIFDLWVVSKTKSQNDHPIDGLPFK